MTHHTFAEALGFRGGVFSVFTLAEIVYTWKACSRSTGGTLYQFFLHVKADWAVVVVDHLLEFGLFIIVLFL